MCGGLLDSPDPPDIPDPPPPEPPPPVFQAGSDQEVATEDVTKKGKKSLVSEGVGLSIPTEG